MDDKGVALREALRLNQRLWSIFQAALTEPDCPLPQEIRENVLTLSIMVDRHMLDRLGDLDGSKIGPILDINRAIAEGLSNKPAAEAAQALAQAQLTTPPPAHPQVQTQSPAPTGRPPVMRVSA
jgi:flagellar protein FlaF